MIARYWSARASTDNLTAYRRHLQKNVFPKLRKIRGFIRADLLTRPEGAEVEIIVLSIWESYAAIESFAGDDREAAVVAPAASALLASYDLKVRHYEISASI